MLHPARKPRRKLDQRLPRLGREWRQRRRGFLPAQLHGALDGGGERKPVRPFEELDQSRVQPVIECSREAFKQLRNRTGRARYHAVRACAQSPQRSPVVAIEKRERTRLPKFQKLVEKRAVAAGIQNARKETGVD